MTNTTTHELREELSHIIFGEVGRWGKSIYYTGIITSVVALIQRENRAFAVKELEKVKNIVVRTIPWSEVQPDPDLLTEDQRFGDNSKETIGDICGVQIDQVIAALTGEE